MWKWQKKGRIYLAGEIAFVTALVIWITSLPQVRRRRFEIFYNTHHLYMVFLVFFLFHTGDRHFYMVFPGVFLFGLDKLLRMIQSRPRTCILSAKIFPGKAVEVILPKDPSAFQVFLYHFRNKFTRIIRESLTKFVLLFNFSVEVYSNKHNIHEDTNHIQVSMAPLQHNF